MQAMETFIRGIPKVELHLHIEGTLEPEMMFALADRNGIKLPYPDVEGVRKAYAFEDLQSFLDLYYQGAEVLLTQDDFADLAWAYLQRAHAGNVRHTEVFFDPQTHTERGIDLAPVIEGLAAALVRARDELGISSGLIPCFLRHLSEAEALQTLELLLPYRDRFVAVGLDSGEVGNPPEKFTTVFAQARDAGLRTVAHAGEEGPPEYIRGALDALGVARIDHGVRCLEDPELVARLVEAKIPLTVCPLSNVKLRVFDRLEDHNLRAMLEQGLYVNINSDDPAYFGGYIEDNYLACWRALGLDTTELYRLASHAVTAAFVSDRRRHQLQAEVDAHFRRAGFVVTDG